MCGALFILFASFKRNLPNRRKYGEHFSRNGIEMIGWTEDGKERVYVLQNSAYRLNGVGIGKAVDIIQKMGLPDKKPCRIIVLDNNIPQISLYYKPIIGDSVPEASRADWDVSYNLGDSWKLVRKEKRKIVLCLRWM